MEHRCSERINTDLKILIYKMGMPVAIGRIKNGSKLGFFIETDFSDVNILQPLDIEIVASSSSKNTLRHKYKSRVVRKSKAGLGLELETLNAESLKILGVLLVAPKVRQEHYSAFLDKTQVSAQAPTMVQAN
jgi:hypothetical protein